MEIKLHEFKSNVLGHTLSFEDALGRSRPITIIVGQNGCGKTRALKEISETIPPESFIEVNSYIHPQNGIIHQNGII